MAIIDHGRFVALDMPENLIRSLRVETPVIFHIDKSWDETGLRNIPGISRVERFEDKLIVYGKREKLVSAVVSFLEEKRLRFHDLRIEQPSLEDVFRFILLIPVDTLMRSLWFGETWRRHLTEVAVLAGVLIMGTALAAWTFRWE